MAGVSDERKEAIWQSAQQKAVRGIPLTRILHTQPLTLIYPLTHTPHTLHSHTIHPRPSHPLPTSYQCTLTPTLTPSPLPPSHQYTLHSHDTNTPSHSHTLPPTHTPHTSSQATDLQPGLKLLLEGEVAASPSTFSLGKEDAAMLGASTRLTPAGSLRHSRHSSRRSSKRSGVSEVHVE